MSTLKDPTTVHADNHRHNLALQAGWMEMAALAERSIRQKFCEDNVMTLMGLQLKGLRKKMNVTQYRMAKVIGMSQSQYSAIERGRGITLSTACRIAHFFDCSVSLNLVSFHNQLTQFSGVSNSLPNSADYDLSLTESALEFINTQVELGRKQLKRLHESGDLIGYSEKRLSQDDQRRQAAADGWNAAERDMKKGGRG